MKTQAITKSDVYSQGLKYSMNSDNQSYSVKKGTCTDINIIIPETYNNLPVTVIGACAFQFCSGVTSITIPNSVTSIDVDAFYGCTGLTSIMIPNSVTSIESDAFNGCTGLTSITIPGSVTSIGYRAFSGCTGLTSIYVDSKSTHYRSVNNCLIETVTKTLIAGCKNSVIPDDGSVTSIGDYAFSGCTGFTSITIPDSVKSIGDYAFSSCTGLTSITIPNSITSIGNSAFQYCTGLTSITIPNSVTSIGELAFNNCIALTSIMIPNSVTSIESDAFNGCTGLTSITIPNSVTSIGYYAFCRCTGLTSITIPNSVTSIGVGAFYGCTGLTSITIPDSVTSIDQGAFEDCSGLHKNGTFKATDEDMCCRQFQYNLGEKFETTHASLSECGFHFCTNAFDLLNYYSGEIGRAVRFFEVEVDKVTEEHSSDSKRVCKELTFLREIKSYAELLN